MQAQSLECGTISILISYLVFCQFIYFSHCSIYATLNGNEWLTEFDNCNVNISNLDPDIWDVGRFEYPVILSKGNGTDGSTPICQYLSTEISNETEQSCFQLSYRPFLKRIFCTVTTFIVPKGFGMGGSDTAQVLKPLDNIRPTCSNSIYPSIHSPPVQYTWTACILILVEQWDRKMERNMDNEIHRIFLYGKLAQTMHAIEFFVFFYNPVNGSSTNFQISFVDYVHSPLVTWDSHISCKSPKCRMEMEDKAKDKTLDGRNAPGSVTSQIAPYENVVGEKTDYYRALKFKSRSVSHIYIFTQDTAFKGLEKLSFRDYYFNHRSRINFIRINQAILYEKVSRNISEKLFHFRNEDIASFNPTATNSFLNPNQVQTTNISFLDFRIYYDMKAGNPSNDPQIVYPTGETYFNFLTCHGIRKIAPLTAFLQPFEFQVWITMIVVQLSLVLISVISLAQGHQRLSQILSESETLTFYIISVLLENGFENLKPPARFSKAIPKLVFIILAFMCVILGCLYKSIITADIIQPIPVTIPYQYYSQLQNFELVALPAKDLLAIPREAQKLRRSKNVTNGNSLYEIGIEAFGLGQYISLIYEYLGDTDKDTESEILKKATLQKYYHHFLTRVRIFEYEEDALDRISNCKEKKAFVGSAEEIEEFLTFTKQKVKLRKGKDKYLSHNNYWNIPNSAGGFVHRRMAQLLSSGIYHIWKKVFYRKTRDELDISLKISIETKQSLDTNLGVLFRIICLGLAVSFFVFSIEVMIWMLQKSFGTADK